MQASKGQTVFRGYLPSLIALAVCLGTLLYNLFCFSALANEARIGGAMRTGFNGDAPIAAAYVLGGDLLRKIPGLTTLGDDTARAIADPLQESIRGFPSGAVAIFFGQAQTAEHKRLLWTHRLQPWLIVLAAFLWWRRPRPVHLRQRLRP